MLAAVDFTPASARVCRAAAEYAALLGAEVVLVNVVHELAALLGAYTHQSVRELQDALERRGGEKLRALAAEHFAGRGIAHRVVLAVGTPWAEILDCALHEDACLLVIGTHGLRKPEHVFVGSTVQRVIEHARCRVLLVPPE
ncbi:MAG TPA: universal stress protein [Planctomycetota bacterium]|nr:universal stress protein [Planctomycetota bacterium]